MRWYLFGRHGFDRDHHELDRLLRSSFRNYVLRVMFLLMTGIFWSFFLWFFGYRGEALDGQRSSGSTVPRYPLFAFVLDTDSPGTGQDVRFSQSARIMC
jgi:hypothetical protein